MLKYNLNLDLQSKLNRGQLVISSYEVNTEKNDVTILIKDIVSNKFLKVLFKNAQVLDETFDIVNKPVFDIVISDYVKYFKSSHFIGIMLVVKNPNNHEQEFAIISQIGG